MSNVRMVSCKSEADIPLDNISLEVVDNKIMAVILKGPDGSLVKITKSNSYGEELKVCKDEPLVEVDEWCLSGKLLGVTDFSETFKDETAAQNRHHDIKNTTGVYDDEQLGLSIEKKTVLVNSTKLI